MKFGVCSLLLLVALLEGACAKGCRYGHGHGATDGPCDPVTNQQIKTLVLKKGDPDTCPPTKEVTRPCKDSFAASEDSCKYQWDATSESSECDPDTGMRTVQMTLIEGDPNTCEQTKTSNRKCEVPAGGNKKDRQRGRNKNKNGRKDKNKDKEERKKSKKMKVEQDGCMYGLGEGSVKGDCFEDVNGTMTMTVTLVLQDSETGQDCAQSITRVVPCKGEKTDKGCKYKMDKSTDGDNVCDPSTGLKTFKKVLQEGSPEDCPADKSFTKKCVPEECVYAKGTWSECGENDKMSQRTDTLVNAPEGVHCEPEVSASVKCSKLAKKLKKDSRKNKDKNKKKDKKDKKKQERQERKEARRERGKKNKQDQS